MIEASNERAAWLAERMSGIGGSDAPAALGLSKWKTPYQLWQEKRGEISPQPTNWAMRWGLAMEPELRQHYSDITGREVFMAHGLVRHPKRQWMFFTPDGGTADKRVLQIKTSRSTDGWGEPGTADIPQHYLIQVQHEMYCAGFEVADVLLGVYQQEPLLYEVPADPELQELIVDAEAEFWARVQSGEPPAPSSYADVVSRWGRASTGNRVIADTQIANAVGRLRTVRNEIAGLEQDEEALKAQIMTAIGESDTLVDPAGKVLCTWKAVKAATRFDAKALERDNPALYKQYLRAGEPSRRFLLK